jgi:ABC-type lipoprotein export system ATPase subunit
MERNKKKCTLEFVKIENFKSYKHALFFGPLSTFSCISGKNGSGKTNIGDSILFSLGLNLNDINLHLLQNIFPNNILKKNIMVEAKIGLRMQKQNKKIDFIRTFAFDNLSEFFINGIKVSFKIYKKTLEKLNICEYRHFMVIRNILEGDFFLRNNKLSEIIDKLSNSNKLSFAQLKYGLLRKKFQKNAFFFFQKLKFLLNERINLVEKLTNFIHLKKLEESYKLKKKNEYLFETISLMYKIWMLFKKKKKMDRKEKEMYYQNYLFFFLIIDLKKNLKKYNYINFVRRDKFLSSLSTIFDFIKNLNYKILKIKKKCLYVYYMIIFDIEIAKFPQIPFIHKKIIKNQNFYKKKNKSKFYFISFSKIFKKKNFNNFLSRDKNFFLSLTKKSNNFYNNTNFRNKFLSFVFYTRYQDKIQCRLFIKTEKFVFLLKKEKLIVNSFHRNVLFFFILLEIKKHKNKNENIQKKIAREKTFFHLKFYFPGIRGKILELFKPLDSSLRKSINLKLQNDTESIIVNKMETAVECLKFLGKKKKFTFKFLSAKELSERTIEKAEIEQKVFLYLTNLLDFDQYDYNSIYFLVKSTLFFFSADNLIVKKLENTPLNFCISSEILIEQNNFFTISYYKNQNKKKSDFFFYDDFRKKKNFFLDIFTKMKLSGKKMKNFFLNNIDLDNKKKIFVFSKKKNFKKIKKIYYVDKFGNKISQNNKKKKSLDSLFFFQLIFIFYKMRQNQSIFKNFKIYSQKKLLGFFKKMYQTNESLEITRGFHFIIYWFKIKNSILKKEKQKIFKPKNTAIFRFFLKKLYHLYYFVYFICNYMKKKINIYEKKSNQNYKLTKYLRNEKMKLNQSILNRNFVKNMIKKFSSNEKNLQKILKIKLEIFLTKEFCYFLVLKFFFSSKTHYNLFFKKKKKIFNFYHFCKIHFCKKATRINIKKSLLEKMFPFKNPRIQFKLIEDFQKRLSLIEDRKNLLKAKLIQSRYNFLIANSKYHKIIKEREKRFRIYCEKISQQVNFFYKNMTKNFLNPNGGTAFLTIEKNQKPFLGKVLFTAVPPSKALKKTQSLSGGEKTFATIALIISFGIVNNQPFILLDEIDTFLDLWHTEKIFLLLKDLSKNSQLQIFIITLQIKFLILFRTLICLFKNKLGSNVFVINTKQ